MEDHTKLKETAYHESGHAVAAYLMNLEFDKVTIIPNYEENYCGACILRDKIEINTNIVEDLPKAMRILSFGAGGPVAKALFTGNYGKMTFDIVDNLIKIINSECPYDSDCGQMKIIVENYFSKDSMISIVMYRSVIGDIATEFKKRYVWAAVKALANALLEKREIYYDPAIGIISKYIRSERIIKIF